MLMTLRTKSDYKSTLLTQVDEDWKGNFSATVHKRHADEARKVLDVLYPCLLSLYGKGVSKGFTEDCIHDFKDVRFNKNTGELENLKPAKLDYSLLSLYDHVQSPAEKNEILANGGTPDDFEMLEDDEDSDEDSEGDDDESSKERIIDFDLKATFCQDFLPSKSGPQYDSNSIATNATGATGATEAAIAEEQKYESEEEDDNMEKEQHGMETNGKNNDVNNDGNNNNATDDNNINKNSDGDDSMIDPPPINPMQRHEGNGNG